MIHLKIIAVAFALAMDAMSVSMAVGVRWHGRRQRFRLAWHMGLWQLIMPLMGWSVGVQAARALRSAGAYVAGALVFGIGAKMLYEALKSAPGSIEKRERDAVAGALHLTKRDPTRGWSLVLLSVATSVDALVVGFSLGLKGSAIIWEASVVIGIVAAAMSLTGVAIGKRVGQALGRSAELLGAGVLMILGVLFVWL